jgi:hypothetical protein
LRSQHSRGSNHYSRKDYYFYHYSSSNNTYHDSGVDKNNIQDHDGCLYNFSHRQHHPNLSLDDAANNINDHRGRLTLHNDTGELRNQGICIGWRK